MLRRLMNALSFFRSFPASWRASEINLQALRNEISLRASENNLQALRNEINVLQNEICAITRAFSDLSRETSRNALLSRTPPPRRPQHPKSVNLPCKPYLLNEKLDALRALHPAAYDVWIKTFEEGRRCYEVDPLKNLSVQGHQEAELFRAFIAPYMKGSVLDVGCGPQELPVYLLGFEVERLAGLDPLFGSEKRRMEFCQGFAEFLPWEDAQFDVVIFATSLDHVLCVDKTLAEVHRVLRPGGVCMVWAGLVEGSARYEPDREPVIAIDEFHLFHFSEETLLEAFQAKFELFEKFIHGKVNGFYVFLRQDDL
jgi:SAM-dependent methyltransferase